MAGPVNQIRPHPGELSVRPARSNPSDVLYLTKRYIVQNVKYTLQFVHESQNYPKEPLEET
jgi:hypothetical protein